MVTSRGKAQNPSKLCQYLEFLVVYICMVQYLHLFVNYKIWWELINALTGLRILLVKCAHCKYCDICCCWTFELSHVYNIPYNGNTARWRNNVFGLHIQSWDSIMYKSQWKSVVTRNILLIKFLTSYAVIHSHVFPCVLYVSWL